jgi:hypothetical protein
MTQGRSTDNRTSSREYALVSQITPRDLEEETEMSATSLTERRELDHRTTNGIEVTLFWSTATNRVTIAVLDTHSDESLEFDVDGTVALDAFKHPYAYAATVASHDHSRSRHVQPTHPEPAGDSAR